jgi:hypothetical protein
MEQVADVPEEIPTADRRLISVKQMRLEKFNCCEPSSIVAALQSFEVGSFTIRDLRGSTWSNGSDTLVLMFKSSKDVKLGVELTKMLKELGADEINVRYADKKLFMRFWWD